MRKRYILAVVLLIAGLIIAADALFWEPYRVQVSEIAITHEQIGAGLAGLRIAQISDTHIVETSAYHERLALKLYELRPDLVVITGDVIEHVAAYELWVQQAQAVHRFLEMLPPASYGIWVTRGNTDISRYGGHSDFLVQQIRATSAQLLINEHARLEIHGSDLYLAGADFAHLPQRFSADHLVQQVAGNRVLAAEPCQGNAFSHMVGETLPAEGYEFTGRLRYSDPEGGVGILIDSKQPNGENRFIRIRRHAEQPAWTLAAKGIELTTVRADGPEPEVGRWYRFRIRLAKRGERRIQARIWPEDGPQSQGWNVETSIAYPVGSDGDDSGTIGFWSVGPGWKQFDELTIHDLDGKLLWSEDFESLAAAADPPYWLDFGINKGNVRQAMNGVPEEAFTALLAHSPDQIDEARSTGADLMLSGHTHGGQVRLPLIGPLYINTELGRRYSQGLFQFGDTTLYVNRGLGTRGIRIRFLCRPEITVFTLHPAPDIAQAPQSVSKGN